MELEGVDHQTVNLGAASLHVVTTGEGKPVVLLHGFPEFWYGWRHQMDVLANSGLRLIVPDQRGYNTSDKPREVGSSG